MHIQVLFIIVFLCGLVWTSPTKTETLKTSLSTSKTTMFKTTRIRDTTTNRTPTITIPTKRTISRTTTNPIAKPIPATTSTIPVQSTKRTSASITTPTTRPNQSRKPTSKTTTTITTPTIKTTQSKKPTSKTSITTTTTTTKPTQSTKPTLAATTTITSTTKPTQSTKPTSTMTTTITTPKTTTISATTTPTSSAITRTSFPQSDVILLNQLIRQETTLRFKLEETVKQLMDDFENMKYLQLSSLMKIKEDQDVLNQQLLKDIMSISIENESLKQELSTIKNNSLKLNSCDCNFKNVTTELKDFKTNFRYMTLSLLDIQQKTDVMQDRIDDKIVNLTARFSDLENQDASLLSTIEILERIHPKVERFMNESSEKTAFTATVTQEMTSKNGQTLVFPHIITNVGGGYNGHTGVFTAPRDGVYVFLCRITAAYNPDSMFFEFILNGSAKTRNLVFGRSANPYRTSFDSIVLRLSHGDRVWIKMVTGGNHYSSGTGGDQTFSGYLL